jgi:ATP-dependent Lhr-like helicase
MSLKYENKRHSLKQVMDLMDPLIQKWFMGKFQDLTEPQAYAIPLIHKGVNVLVSSPTGSGKTITAFLSIINELFQLKKAGQLENRIYCIYISPLKALANDINKNLNEPLAEIYALARQEGHEPPAIRVAVRSGDTSNYERQKMAKTPPHIFITTPESIALVLSTPKFSQNFRHVKWVIVDEIHEVSSSKRGVLLSLNLERLQGHVEDEFTRVGLSATQAPIEEIAKFLVGYNKGKLRDCNIIQSSMTKRLDLGILCPVKDMTALPYEVVNHKMYDQLQELIGAHKTTLIFTNTRSGTESVVYRLKEKGINDIAAHHGSLSRETRLEVEDLLRNGKLKSVVTSTSLELGIDIGHIDLVCQIGSPKSVAKGLQRIGRSGHGVHETAKGRFLVVEKDDLVETAVLVKSAIEGRIDRINLLHNNLDVLAQVIVGMSLEERWTADQAFELVQRSYCYKDLERKEFDTVLDYLAGRFKGHEGGFSRIWMDEDGTFFGAKKGTRMIYYLNMGTIPEEANYKVLSNKGPLGKLSEKFVERLAKGDIFVLGGKTYEFEKSRGMTVFVKDAQGRRPTVPSWSGEMLPRSFDLSQDIGRFRARVEKLIKAEKRAGHVEAELQAEYKLDEGSAKSLYSYFKEQMGVAPVPTDKRLLIEGYLDSEARYNIIFHFCYGRRVNDALARAYAYALSKKAGVNVRVSLTDDNFMLTVPKDIKLKGIEKLVTPKTLEPMLKASITSTELFKQRFRHCAMRSFMILRNFRGKEIPVSRQLKHASRLLEALGSGRAAAAVADEEGHGTDQALSDGFPVIEETYNEILHDALDVDNAKAVIEAIVAGKVEVVHVGYSDIASPFAHNIVLIGASDMILMEDRSGLLKELRKQVLGRIIADMPDSTLDPKLVAEHYLSKQPVIESKDDLVPFLKVMGPMNVLQDKGESIFRYSHIDFETMKKWATELVAEGALSSVWREGPLWAPTEDVEMYRLLYAKPCKMTAAEKKVLKGLDKVDPDKRATPELRALEQAFIVERIVTPEGKLVLQERGLPRLVAAPKPEGPEPPNGNGDTKVNGELNGNGNGGPELVEGIHIEGWAGVSQAPPVKTLDDALRVVMRNHLEFRPPMTIEEISVKLALGEILVESVLKELGTEVSTIQLEATTRYLLSRDKVRISDQKRLVFGEREVRQFVIRKHFFTCTDIADYFSKFYEANMTLDIFNRVERFDINTWWKGREGGEILEGRFVKGRVGFMTRPQSELMDRVAMRPTLNIQDMRILKAIQAQSGIGLWDLVRIFEDKYPKVLVKESLDKLDHGLYVVRVQNEHREWPTRNRYSAFGPGTLPFELPKADGGRSAVKGKRKRGRPKKADKAAEEAMAKIGESILNQPPAGPQPAPGAAPPAVPFDEAARTLVMRCIELYGPAHIPLIRYHTGLGYDEIHRAIDRLETEAKIVRLAVVNGSSIEMFIMPKELEELKIMPRTAKFRDRLRILSQYDPYTRRLWLEIANRYGEGWFFPVVKDGKLSGVVEMWNLSGCVEIREAALDDEAMLPELLEELERHLEYHKLFGTEVIRFKRALGKAPAEMSEAVLKQFMDKGYVIIQGMLVKGQVRTETYPKANVLAYIFWRQHLTEDNKFRDTFEAIRGMGGMHSEFEVEARVRIFHPLRKYRDRLVTCLAIPEYLTYCTFPDLLLYKSAKNRELDPGMKVALALIKGSGAMTRQELQKRLGLDQDAFNSVMKDLYTALHVIKDQRNMFVPTEEPPVATADARKTIMKRIIDNFGIISAEKIAAYTKHEFKMSEIRDQLKAWENEGWLVKGYLVEGDDTLYWVVREDMERLSKSEAVGNRVLTTTDPVAQYLQQEIKERYNLGTCYLVFKGTEMVGAFKATRRSGVLAYTDFVGNDEAMKILQDFGRRWGLKVTEKKFEEGEDDWELMLWYEKRKMMPED